MKYLFLGVIVPFSILLPIFFALFFYKRLDRGALIIFYYLLVSAVVSVLAEVSQRLFKTNLPLLHFYTLAEVIILVEFYKLLPSFQKNRKALTYVQFFFTAFCIANVFLWQNIFTYNSYSLSLGALILMLLSVIFYAHIFGGSIEGRYTANATFWFNSGIFIYFSSSFFLFIFSNFFMVSSKGIFIILWNIHAAFVLIMYILFTIGFNKCKK